MLTTYIDSATIASVDLDKDEKTRATIPVEFANQTYRYEVSTVQGWWVTRIWDGESLRVFFHHIIREDDHTLIAFPTTKHREVFRTLIKVPGVGAKVALRILSGGTLEEFLSASSSDDLKGIPGVGSKGPSVWEALRKANLLSAEAPRSPRAILQDDRAKDAIAAAAKMGIAKTVAEGRLRDALKDLPEGWTSSDALEAILRC